MPNSLCSIYVGYVVHNSLFFNRVLLLVHLLESGEFVNVGLFCRGPVFTQGMLVYFYFNACLVFFFVFFFSFIYLFMPSFFLFFLLKGKLFCNLLFICLRVVNL